MISGNTWTSETCKMALMTTTHWSLYTGYPVSPPRRVQTKKEPWQVSPEIRPVFHLGEREQSVRWKTRCWCSGGHRWKTGGASAHWLHCQTPNQAVQQQGTYIGMFSLCAKDFRWRLKTVRKHPLEISGNANASPFWILGLSVLFYTAFHPLRKAATGIWRQSFLL